MSNLLIPTIEMPKILSPNKWLGGLLSTINSLGRGLTLTPMGGTALSTVTGLLGNTISGGNSTGIGNLMQGAGGIVGMVNPIAGAIVSGAGALINGAFGSNINEDFVNQTRDRIDRQLAYTSNALDLTGLMNDWNSFTDMGRVTKDLVGSDGWFSNRASKATDSLNKDIDNANFSAWNNISKLANNINTNNYLSNLAHFSAYGGPINMKYTGTMSPFGNLFKDGGEIYIKPENRGKFTALKERTGKSATWFKLHGTPALKKMAVFALNAKKWKHEDGGPIKDGDNTELESFWDKMDRWVDDAEGALALTDAGLLATTAVAPNPVTPFIGYGTSVLGGLADIYQGIRSGIKGDYANIVKNAGELGLSLLGAKAFKAAETSKDLYKSAKTSDSLTPVVKRIRNPRYHGRLGLPKYFNHITSLESIDTWDNYLKTAGIIGANTISNFLDFSDSKLENIKALGGELTHGGIFSNGITSIGNGGTHEQNPNEGVQIGTDQLGIPNLVEEGELIWDDYVFSNRIKVPKAVRQKYKLRENATYADAAKKLLKESEERPNDPISTNGLNVFMNDLRNSLEELRIKKEKRNNIYDIGGSLRYAPIAGAALSVVNDMTGGNNPDYTNADLFKNAIQASNRQVGYRPIGQYLRYEPLDTDYYISRLDANASSGRRAMQNIAGGNRATALAGILGSDYNYITSLGQLARQAEEYNQAQKQKVAEFNRATDQYNSDLGTRVDMFNTENAIKRALMYNSLATMRLNIYDRNRAERIANLTNFILGLGDYGRESKDRDMIDFLAKLGVLKYDSNGRYTGGGK